MSARISGDRQTQRHTDTKTHRTTTVTLAAHAPRGLTMQLVTICPNRSLGAKVCVPVGVLTS